MITARLSSSELPGSELIAAGLADSGEAAGPLSWVMPFVAGEALRGRLDCECTARCGSIWC